MFNEKAFSAQRLTGSDIPAIAGGGSRPTSPHAGGGVPSHPKEIGRGVGRQPPLMIHRFVRYRQQTTGPVLNTAPPRRMQPKEKTTKIIHTYNVYNLIMSAVKRIPVTEPVWKDLAEMRTAGQTYTDLLAEMIEDRKRRRLEEDVKTWSSRKKKGYVSLSEIKD